MRVRRTGAGTDGSKTDNATVPSWPLTNPLLDRSRLTASLDGDLIDITVAFSAEAIGRVYKSQMPLAFAAIGGTRDPDLQAVGEIGGRPLTDEVAFRLYRTP